jgi:RNA recognition motif-containing protein
MMDYYQQSNTSTSQKPNKVEKNINTNLVLFLGELPPDVDQYELHQFIMEQGKFNVESLIVKPIPKENKSYAYVKFKVKSEVEKARKALNFKPYKNYLIKAELFRGKDSLKEEQSANSSPTNLFVKNLSSTTTPKELYELFSQYGEIISIKVKQNNKGECLGYGYVNFQSSEHAQEALSNLNGKELGGKKLFVNLFHSKSERSINEENKFPLIVIKKLPEVVKNEDSLRVTFSRFGQIIFCGILDSKNEEDDSASRSGYVLFSSKEEAEDALNSLNETTLDDSEETLLINYAPINQETIEKLGKARRESYKNKYEGCNLVVKNLPKEINDKHLYDICRQFGDVANAKIATEGVIKVSTDKNGQVLDKEFVYESKGYGFVRFKSSEVAKKAKEALNTNSVMFLGLTLTLNVEYYDYSKAERAKEFRELSNQENYHKGKNMHKNKFKNNKNIPQLRNEYQIPNAKIINDRAMIPPRMNYNNPINFNKHPMMQNQFKNPTPMGQGLNRGFPNQVPNQFSQNMYNPHVNAQMNQINSQISQINPFGNPQVNKSSEDLEFLEEVKKILRKGASDERTEHLGETIFYYLLRFISKYNLNTSKGRFDDPTLCSKLTGMFLSIEEADLMEIISKNEVLTMTIMDVVNVRLS